MDTRQQKAFSLVELIASTAVLGILLGLALPGLHQLIQNNQDQALRHLLAAHLQHARAQAILLKRSHDVCGSSDGRVCDGDWNRHWLLMAPTEGQMLRRHSLPDGDATICWRGFSPHIRFQANGTSPTGNGRFALCRADRPVWQLVLNRQGRLRQAAPADATGCCTTDHTGR